MEQPKKKNFKNKLWYGSKISQYKLEKVLRYFAHNVPAKQASAQTGISIATIRNCYSEFRNAMFFAAVLYGRLFNGAGYIMLFGCPPNKDQLFKLVNKRRLGKSKHGDRFLEEVAVRWYCGYYFNEAELAVFAQLAFVLKAKFHGVYLKDHEKTIKFLELAPEETKHVMTDQEFRESEYVRMYTAEYVSKIWNETYYGRFKVPDFIWYLVNNRKEYRYASETIYRDLRWYLLKHPINGKRRKPTHHSEGYPYPPIDKLKNAGVEMFTMLKPFYNPDKKTE
ncbi:MAG: hypothetical protein ABW098_18760 [Candidatus Thiodiazotropha sp.]